MPILLFLIDTSASMNQRTDLGTSYLDIAKGAVELFLKVKGGEGRDGDSSRGMGVVVDLAARPDPASRGDRYMLVTYDEPPYCIKVKGPSRGGPGGKR
ncbi:Integrator complex subunit 6-like [Camelus dromedarius]|uniref:Integrator complex subunit 6-like n=1 Tax=Camelus dromedarius TaxID=9838 RepID=A0A5N4C2E8_CAMDR|nr:Integrator complex subunit 6-like [Camelus dromedarius]